MDKSTSTKEQSMEEGGRPPIGTLRPSKAVPPTFHDVYKDFLSETTHNKLRDQPFGKDEPVSPRKFSRHRLKYYSEDPALTARTVDPLDKTMILRNPIRSADVSTLIHDMQKANKAFTVHLKPNTKFFGDSQERLFKGFATLQVKMEELDLGGNPIDDEAAKSVAEAIANIKKLSLEWCLLSSYGITSIMNGIGSLSQPMEELDLRWNSIDDEAAKSVAEAIFNIKTLHVQHCNLSEEATAMIRKKISSLPQPMEELNISQNTIDDEAAKSLAEATTNIKKLFLERCDLSSRGITFIMKGIELLSQPKLQTRLHLRPPWMRKMHELTKRRCFTRHPQQCLDRHRPRIDHIPHSKRKISRLHQKPMRSYSSHD